MTNYERMISEDKREYAKDLATQAFCPYFDYDSELCSHRVDCVDCIEVWLNEEETREDCESCKIEEAGE